MPQHEYRVWIETDSEDHADSVILDLLGHQAIIRDQAGEPIDYRLALHPDDYPADNSPSDPRENWYERMGGRYACADPTHPARECDPERCAWCAEHCAKPAANPAN